MNSEPVFVKHSDRWVVSVKGATVSRCSFDWAVTWVVTTESGDVEIRIEQPFMFGDRDPIRLVPEHDPVQLAPVLSTVRDSVVRIEAFTDGRLELEFGGGAIATVVPSEEFESWTLTGPGDLKLIAIPGGGVVTWSSNGPNRSATEGRLPKHSAGYSLELTDDDSG